MGPHFLQMIYKKPIPAFVDCQEERSHRGRYCTLKVPKTIARSRSSPATRNVWLASIEISMDSFPTVCAGSAKSSAKGASACEIAARPISRLPTRKIRVVGPRPRKAAGAYPVTCSFWPGEAGPWRRTVADLGDQRNPFSARYHD